MRVRSAGEILAVVTTKEANVTGSQLILRSETAAEAAERAQLLARILDAMVHDVGDDVFLIVRH